MAIPATFELAPADTRRGRYQRFMRAFNPTAPAAEAIAESHVDESLRGGLHRQIATRAELDRGSQQLVLGGIGSGKSTELMLTRKALGQRDGLLPVYVDVSAATDLTQVAPGVLLACFGMALLEHVPADTSLGGARREIRDFARGFYYEPVDEGPYESTLYAPGKLKPQSPPYELESIAGAIGRVVETIAAPTAIFDGLDKLVDPKEYWKACVHDLPLLKNRGISTVLAAPLIFAFEPSGQQILEGFELREMYDVPMNGEGLARIIRLRDNEIIPATLHPSLAVASGGVLRDLMTVARDAGEAAYLDNRDQLTQKDVDKATERLGRSLLRGMGQGDLERVKALQYSRSFDPQDADGRQLLATRRVLEYSETEFRVHPALLRAMGEPSRG